MKVYLVSVGLMFGYLVAAAQTPIVADKLVEKLNSASINKGCSIAARLTVESLKKVGTASCVIPEPTMGSKVACAIGLALQKKPVGLAVEKGTTAGCTWVVKKVSETVVEVTIEVVDGTKISVQDLRQEVITWVKFLNTLEGAIWFVNKLGGS